jgi:phosphoenolpyruvate carboxykinase (GTP)
MAMLPFCGYNMADYFAHWLEVGKALKSPPKIFRVNWFRTNENGKFIWPGFGENLRVLQWILERCDGRGKATDTAIGFVPTVDGINHAGLDLPENVLAGLLKVDPAEWHEAVAGQDDYMKSFGKRMPEALWDEHNELAHRVQEAAGTAVGNSGGDD